MVARKRRDRRNIKRQDSINSPREFGLTPMVVQDGSSMHTPPKPGPPPNTEPKPSYYVQRDEFDTVLDELQHYIMKLELRIEALEAGDKPLTKPEDELREKIVRFLKSMPGVKVTTGTIAANLGSESRLVSHRCRTLANNGIVKMDKVEGYSTVFWYEEKASE